MEGIEGRSKRARCRDCGSGLIGTCMGLKVVAGWVLGWVEADGKGKG